jgi:hypothetical protein
MKTIGYVPIVDGEVIDHKVRSNRGLKTIAENKERRKRRQRDERKAEQAKKREQEKLLHQTFRQLRRISMR